MTATLQLPVQTLNSNHPGVEFGVVCLEESALQMSLDECRSLLAEDGWTHVDEMPGVRAGTRKFLVSRKK